MEHFVYNDEMGFLDSHLRKSPWLWRNLATCMMKKKQIKTRSESLWTRCWLYLYSTDWKVLQELWNSIISILRKDKNEISFVSATISGLFFLVCSPQAQDCKGDKNVRASAWNIIIISAYYNSCSRNMNDECFVHVHVHAFSYIFPACSHDAYIIINIFVSLGGCHGVYGRGCEYGYVIDNFWLSHIDQSSNLGV